MSIFNTKGSNWYKSLFNKYIVKNNVTALKSDSYEFYMRQRSKFPLKWNQKEAVENKFHAGHLSPLCGYTQDHVRSLLLMLCMFG